jgi:hypothetical protein
VPFSEISRDGIRIRLKLEDSLLVMQLLPVSDEDPEPIATVQCDPDVLCSVVRGITYQMASESGFCLVRRVGSNVIFNFDVGRGRLQTRLSTEEFKRLVAPVMPLRLQAMLL